MASLTDRSDSESYHGDDIQEIAQRVWGKGAWVKRTDTIGDGCHLGQVLGRGRQPGTWDVLAGVVIRSER
jgi:hypothetical protein